ncbi:four helix bundle protein, partial [Patescibacteria group bacterium]|nr:four helix bundle protein [Patescibacteria group bacterium]
ASSRKDFKNKIYICKKECKETKYWLEILAEANPEIKNSCRELWKEAQELTLIFSKTILTLEGKNKL